MEFEWDPEKAASNRKKHGIDFADAVGVLYDDFAFTISEEHPEEERFVTLGADFLGRLLVVVYCWRGEVIRIISAWKAPRSERKRYEEQR
jgi:hypothetical protein